MGDEYNANQYQEQTSLAKISSIFPQLHGDMPNTMEMQARYDMWMAGGGKPDVEGSPSMFMSTQFHITVYRPVNRHEFRKVKLRAWKNMPLFYCDIIETSPYLKVLVEFVDGGIVGIKTSALAQILNQEVQDLNHGNKNRLIKVIDKFIINHKSDPLNIEFKGGLRG